MVATQPHWLLKEVSGTESVVTSGCIVQAKGKKATATPTAKAKALY
jgi:hypothetical protein